LAIVLSVFFFWSLYCQQRPKKIDRQYNDQKKKDEKTDNTMDKRKRHTIQWSKEKDRQYNSQKKTTDNTMTKRKIQTIQ
jgi:ABC-type nickel/cobalt efflux system permease component RcnA